MTTDARVELQPYEPRWLPEVLPMWRASFEAGVGITDPHPIEEQRQHFLLEVEPRHAVCLALQAGALVGFAAASPVSVSQLYVRVGRQRAGIGSLLLDWAKQGSAGSLWLYTFARNRGACAFYEGRGFIAVERGFESHWGLEDVKYQWTR